jgi:hypothetical protein
MLPQPVCVARFATDRPRPRRCSVAELRSVEARPDRGCAAPPHSDVPPKLARVSDTDAGWALLLVRLSAPIYDLARTCGHANA